MAPAIRQYWRPPFEHPNPKLTVLDNTPKKASGHLQYHLPFLLS